MSYLRSEHEKAAYARVFHVGTGVYVNKLGIRDKALLEDTERAITRRRARQGFPRRAHFRNPGLKIRKHLFRQNRQQLDCIQFHNDPRKPLRKIILRGYSIISPGAQVRSQTTLQS